VPIYEYQCCSCGRITEALQKFSDVPLVECPHCKGSLYKLISHSAFHLKGSGWYVTDYAGKKSGSSAASEGGSKDEKPTSKSDDGGTKNS